MIDNFAISFAVAFIALLLAVLTLIAVRRIEARPTTDPRLQPFLKALEPHINEALYAAATLAERVLKTTQTALEDPEKRKIAYNFYTLLPDTIVIDAIPIHISEIKSVISQTQWNTMIDNGFNAADSRIIRNEAWLWQQVLKLAPTPPTVPPQPPAPSQDSTATPDKTAQG